jgi:hypothetical protein
VKKAGFALFTAVMVVGAAALGLEGVGRLALDAKLSAGAEGMRADDVRMALLAVGDTGKVAHVRAFDEQLAVAAAMAQEGRSRPVDALVFLGDNFYYDGLRAVEHVARIREDLVRPYCPFVELRGARSHEVADACRPSSQTRTPVPLYAVLGNHDYGTLESPGLEEDVVPEFVSNWRLFASPGVVELSGGVSLIPYDTMHPDPDALTAALRRSRGPWRILAAHHPINDVSSVPTRSIVEAGVPVHLQLAGHYHELAVSTPDELGVPLQVVAGSGSGARASDHPPLDARFERIVPGFVRIELRVEGADQRLVATLFEAPRYPIEFWQDARPVSAWSVDLAGRVREEMPSHSDEVIARVE